MSVRMVWSGSEGSQESIYGRLDRSGDGRFACRVVAYPRRRGLKGRSRREYVCGLGVEVCGAILARE